jgi:alternate signal-mediated exported protein
MKKSTKAAVATGAAAVLLMGGAGTLAYWTDKDDVQGGTLTSGNLDLVVDDCSTAAWTYADSEGTGAVTKIVPGDIVEKDCTGTLSGEGDHLFADIVVDDSTLPAFSLGSDPLTVEVVTTAPVAPGEHIAVTPTGVDVAFTIKVTYPYGSEQNDSQDQSVTLGTTALDSINVLATQVHDATP